MAGLVTEHRRPSNPFGTGENIFSRTTLAATDRKFIAAAQVSPSQDKGGRRNQ
jgi:hypothetical protein